MRGVWQCVCAAAVAAYAILLNQLRDSAHRLRVVPRNLHAKDILTRVSLQESPLGCIALQQRRPKSHLSTGDVGAKALAH